MSKEDESPTGMVGLFAWLISNGKAAVAWYKVDKYKNSRKDSRKFPVCLRMTGIKDGDEHANCCNGGPLACVRLKTLLCK